MPGHWQLRKDASNGETPRGAVRAQGSVDIRMGEPSSGNALPSAGEYIARERATRGIETS